MNLQFSNCGVLKSLTSGFTSLDSTELTQLENIANQCPLEGGQGVFVARSILVQLGNYEFDDRNLCEILEERGSKAQTKEFVAGFYPNPALNEITFIIPNEKDCQSVRLLSTIGQEIFKIAKPVNGQNMKIGQLVTGIYFLEYQYADSSKESFKLIKN